MFSKHSFSLPGFDDLITGAICLALLSEICFCEKLNKVLTVGEHAMLSDRNHNSPGFFFLSLQLSLYFQLQCSQNAVLSTSGTDIRMLMELPNVARLPK